MLRGEAFNEQRFEIFGRFFETRRLSRVGVVRHGSVLLEFIILSERKNYRLFPIPVSKAAKNWFDSSKQGFYTAFIGSRHMTIKLTPEQEQAIQNAIKSGVVRSVDEFIDTAIALLPQGKTQSNGSRQAAVRGMEEFGEKYRLSLGEPITRKLMHEGHRY